MDKSHTDFLKECAAEIATLKERIAALEEKMASYSPEPEEDAVDFTAESIGLEEADSIASPEVPASAVAENRADVTSDAGTSGFANDRADVTSDAGTSGFANDGADAAEDDTAAYAWRKDKPGLRVKNIRSGISLYDRALFIGTLFQEDNALYDATIARLNGMDTLDQAVAYIREQFPGWKLDSDVVYNFMMAIRKKLG